MNVPKRNQLILSSFAEIVLIAFSYLLMLVIALLCVGLPVWAMIASGANYFLSTGFLTAVGASLSFSILRSLWPRKAPVVSVGVPIDLNQQSYFKEFLSGVATSLNQQTLQEARLVTNAGIYMFETGGTLGFGRKRCVAIGLPFFAGLSVGELRAVVAHEFLRSAYSGETRQATNSNPSRAALAAVLNNLAEGPSAKSWLGRHSLAMALRAPVISALQAYWKVFLRISQALSRQRTYWADEVSCQVAGLAAVQQSLQSVERIKAAERRFWPEVVVPSVGAGFRPALAESFTKFMDAPNIAAMCRTVLAARLQQTQAAPFDHEPPLQLRLNRVQQYAASPVAEGLALPAVSLLNKREEAECALLQAAVPKVNVNKLETLDWESSGARIFAPAWKNFVSQNQKMFAGQTVKGLPAILDNLAPLAAKIPDPPGMLLTREQRAERAIGALQTALAVCLLDRGWQLHAAPGEFWLYRGHDQVNVGELMQKLRNGALSTTAWTEWCADAGIADASFAAAH